VETPREAKAGPRRRTRVWVAAACVAYGAWLLFLVVLAVIQKTR